MTSYPEMLAAAAANVPDSGLPITKNKSVEAPISAVVSATADKAIAAG